MCYVSEGAWLWTGSKQDKVKLSVRIFEKAFSAVNGGEELTQVKDLWCIGCVIEVELHSNSIPS
jgi:hypothetical protein